MIAFSLLLKPMMSNSSRANNNPGEKSKGNILVVDDTPDNLRLLALMLSEQGYRVRKALNGQMALKTVQQMLPDLILLDINMPEMNGYEVCTLLKADRLTQDIPIIFISALDDVLDKVRAFQVGGSDYIIKPFQGEEVLARIEHQLVIQRQKHQLQAEIAERQKAEQALQIYLHIVSHDLRNPVLGMAMILKNFLKSSTSASEISLPRPILERMSQSCDRQLALINSLVESQHFDIKGVILNCQSLDFGQLLHQLAAEWEPILTQHQAQLNLKIADPLPLITADSNLLWRVLENLLANALKHNTSNLTITIQVEQREQYLHCQIQDNGVGIHPDLVDSLFERYQRGKNTGKTPGLGLGLYLCRQIIEAHDGQIALLPSSEGATFAFCLPLLPVS